MARPLEALDLDHLARESGLVQRRARKLSARVLLNSLLSVVTARRPSLMLIAAVASAVHGQVVSKQAVWKRLNGACADFLGHVLMALTARVMDLQQPAPGGCFARFTRVLLQDSTLLALPEKLLEVFPGSANQTGKRRGMLRLQTVYDLLHDRYLQTTFSAFTRNDQTAANDILELIGPGDLVLRDLGYFTLASLAAIGNAGAYFLSRLRVGLAVLDPATGEDLKLLERLRGQEALDLAVQLGRQDRLPARLVAVRVPADVAEERRRQARANRDRRCRPSPESLALLDWEIFVTNVPPDIWSTHMAVQVYGLRWRIETLFKLWKSHFHLPDLPQNVSADQVRCLVLARLIHIVIFHRFWVNCRCHLDPPTANRLSILKLGKLWTDAFPPILAQLLGESANPNLLSQILARHATYDKRKRKGFTEIFHALTEQPPPHHQLLS